jgi:glycosyltransferase involved in cell wall biosynthesis
MIGRQRLSEGLPTPVKVLHILGSLDRGGAEMRLIQTLRALPSGSVETHILLLAGRTGDMGSEAGELGAFLHVTHLSAGLPWECWQLFGRLRPQVVHCHAHFSSGIFLLIAALRRVPVRIAHLHSMTDVRPDRLEGRRRKAQRSVSRWLLRHFATDVVAVSRSVLDAQWPARTTGPRAHVVYNGFPAHRSGAAPMRQCGALGDSGGRTGGLAVTLVQLGRLDELKNQLFTVEVFAKVSAMAPGCLLQLIGRPDSDYGARVRERVAALELGDAVVFTGVRSDAVETLLAHASVMVHPTLVEGLPGAIIEAVAVGTPVVATDIAPNREVAQHLRGVTVMPPNSTIVEWARAVLAILDQDAIDPTLRSLRAESFEDSPFSMQSHVEAMLHLWGVASSEPRPLLGEVSLP